MPSWTLQRVNFGSFMWHWRPGLISALVAIRLATIRFHWFIVPFCWARENSEVVEELNVTTKFSRCQLTSVLLLSKRPTHWVPAVIHGGPNQTGPGKSAGRNCHFAWLQWDFHLRRAKVGSFHHQHCQGCLIMVVPHTCTVQIHLCEIRPVMSALLASVQRDAVLFRQRWKWVSSFASRRQCQFQYR